MIEKLKNNYDILLDLNNLNTFKTSVINHINNSKGNIENALKAFKNEIDNQLLTKELKEVNNDNSVILSKINSYKENDNIKNYPSKFEFNLSNESKNSLDKFINKKKH